MRFLAKEVNEELVENLNRKISFLKDKNITPKLVTIRTNENGASISYEKAMGKKIKSLGIEVENKVYLENISQKELEEEIIKLNNDEKVHGILVFQPLGENLDFGKITSLIDSKKDVDGVTDWNLGKVLRGEESGISYCAPDAVMKILEHYNVNLEGKNVVIIGAGLLVGRPLSMLMSSKNATVILCNVFTKNLSDFTKKADIIVSATGVKGLVDDKLVKEGQIVIDVGVKFVNGKIYGDVDLEKVEPIVKAVTPTPGGTGGITNVVLAEHLVKLCYGLNGYIYNY